MARTRLESPSTAVAREVSPRPFVIRGTREGGGGAPPVRLRRCLGEKKEGGARARVKEKIQYW